MQVTVGTTPTRLSPEQHLYGGAIALRDCTGYIGLGGPDVQGVDADLPTFAWAYNSDDPAMMFPIPPDGLWAIAEEETTVQVLIVGG